MTLLDGSAGAGQPYPKTDRSVTDAESSGIKGNPNEDCSARELSSSSATQQRYTWPLEMGMISLEDGTRYGQCIEVRPTYVPVIWEPVDANPMHESLHTTEEGRAVPIKAPYQSCFQGF